MGFSVDITEFNIVTGACFEGHMDSISPRLSEMASQVAATAGHHGPAEECHAGSIR